MILIALFREQNSLLTMYRKMSVCLFFLSFSEQESYWSVNYSRLQTFLGLLCYCILLCRFGFARNESSDGSLWYFPTKTTKATKNVLW